MGMGVGTASAQFGFGIVYDPTNYANALLRYAELQQQLVQLKNSYTQLITQYNLALQMSRNLQNMPARSPPQFSKWRNTLGWNPFKNTGTWVTGRFPALFPTVTTAYPEAPTQL